MTTIKLIYGPTPRVAPAMASRKSFTHTSPNTHQSQKTKQKSQKQTQQQNILTNPNPNPNPDPDPNLVSGKQEETKPSAARCPSFDPPTPLPGAKSADRLRWDAPSWRRARSRRSRRHASVGGCAAVPGTHSAHVRTYTPLHHILLLGALSRAQQYRLRNLVGRPQPKRHVPGQVPATTLATADKAGL